MSDKEARRLAIALERLREVRRLREAGPFRASSITLEDFDIILARLSDVADMMC